MILALGVLSPQGHILGQLFRPLAPGSRARRWFEVTGVLLGKAIKWGPLEYLSQGAVLCDDP